MSQTYQKISTALNELYERITPYNLDWLDDLEKTVDLFLRFEKLSDFITALECVKRKVNGKNSKGDTYKIDRIINKLKRTEPDYLVERLRSIGYRLAQEKNSNFKSAIESQAFRILEQTRLGKRDAVIGMLLRIFMANNKKFPQELIEALKESKYDINLFRSFIYAFLSAFIDTTKEEGEE
ncbi:MAG: hypothetical protein NC904_08305 [Candidatus Omnitrophica bacterium]|nr:hypothetical protein [Candidatus Omnitrophota bacterium]